MRRWHRRIARVLAVVAVSASALPAQRPARPINPPPAWGTNVRLERLYTVGSLDGPAEYAFGSIGQFVGFADGSFALYDGRQRQLRRYDVSGKFLRNIGRTGAGPGEYRDLLGLASLGDTALVIWDPTQRRLTEFALDGTVRNSTTVALRNQSYGADVFGLDQRGVAAVLTTFGPIRRYNRYRLDGNLIDSLGAPVTDDKGFVFFTSDGERDPFASARLAVPYTGGGLLIAHTDSLGFRILGGTAVRRVHREHTPIRLAREERREWIAMAEHMFESAKRYRPPPGTISREPRLVQIPEVKPAIRGVRSDRDGRVWLELYQIAEKRDIPPRPKGDTRPQITWVERHAFDLFSGAGQYLARITFPPKHQLLDARGDRIWALTEGPDGEEVIVVFRLVRGGAS